MVKNKSTGAGHLVRIFGLIVALAAVMGLATCKNGILKGLDDGDDESPPVASTPTPPPLTPTPPPIGTLRSVQEDIAMSNMKKITLTNIAGLPIYYTTDNTDPASSGTRQPYPPAGYLTCSVGTLIRAFSESSTYGNWELKFTVLGIVSSLGSSDIHIEESMRVIGNTNSDYNNPYAESATYLWKITGVSGDLGGTHEKDAPLNAHGKTISVTVTGTGTNAGMSVVITTPVVTEPPTSRLIQNFNELQTELQSPGDMVLYVKNYSNGSGTIAPITIHSGTSKTIKGLDTNGLTIDSTSSVIIVPSNSSLTLDKDLILTRSATATSITLPGIGAFVEVSGGELILKSNAEIKGNATTNSRGVYVSNGGTFTMESGTISGNMMGNGAGVCGEWWHF
ncbi:hypothetical protein ACYULU_15360 [Breznakiellaceae bacterium SP9]